MYFDWKTWGIWLIGFIILVIWVWIPVKEIGRLVKRKRQDMTNRRNETREEK